MRRLVVWAACVLCAGSALEIPGLAWYATQIHKHPIVTKSVTSATVFGASDLCAQKIERQPTVDKLRFAMTTAIGGLYFAPAAHFWYGRITALIPQNQLQHILAKALLGQIFFGPVVTCIFFAAACIQTDMSLRNLPRKIRADLIPVQLAGVRYWPLVDVISYSIIPVAFIPVFINFASFIWTIYLSYKSRASTPRPSGK